MTAPDKSPRTHVDSTPLPTDSMVTVALSEPDAGEAGPLDTAAGTPTAEAFVTSPVVSVHDTALHASESTTVERRGSSASAGSGESHAVDWAELEKKEEAAEDAGAHDMALLLARLELENNALLADSKAGRAAGPRHRSQSRPPSLSQLQRLVDGQEGQDGPRLSLLPSPPPMTELEFWAVLVRDYPNTVARLPTLCLHKIRAGVPAPLRGVVWQSAAGARDRLIEDQYDSLAGESSPYENIINKDLGRSFPGVDMFKDPEGPGQKMLGRVLKCFSLYDHKIGYCQGLGFLVGPLLMQMGDKEAFCVLVRLMEDYDLRSCFLPDLSGLHLRIFQFQKLLHQHMPKLAHHLDDMQIGSAYLSQWFLSFFAVTCPLPMLFRIYDVLFAEGASETLMRVALAIMKRNEQKLLSLVELEDVMQLLLGRQLWDPYGRNAGSADELVNDFVAFTHDVTREQLTGLEQQFKDSQDKELSKQQVQKSAMSFLGRLWGPSNSSTKSVTLSPGLSAPSRPVSFLRRTPSKQSLASTLNSTESDASMATQSTALTELSRGSNGDALSMKSGHGSTIGHSARDRDLHYQIEQLLMSVSQLQRQNTELEAALQKQLEDRKEDHRVVRTVVDKIRKKTSNLSAPSNRESRRRTTITAATVVPPYADISPALPAEAAEIVESLDSRFPVTQTHHRASSLFETKTILRDALTRTKDQLASETMRAQALVRDLNDRDTELQHARDALKDTRARLQESYHQNQKQEKTIQDLRQNARKNSAAVGWSADTGPDTPPSLSRSTTAESVTGGLRELRLGRANSQKSVPTATAAPVFNKRSSSLATQAVLATENHVPADTDALLLELVAAKTAEAVARQELDELRGKFDGLRRVISGTGSPGATPTAVPSAAVNVGKREDKPAPAVAPAAPTAPPSAGGWTWGGWKRTASTTNASAS